VLTSSKKAKGRRLQQFVRDALLKLGESFGLKPDDVRSTSMGAGGVDVLLSTAAKKLFPLDIECKNRESLNVTGTFWKHYNTYKSKNSMPILVHSRNRSEPLVTMHWNDFTSLLQAKIHAPTEE
jgi:hypothetical protein